MARMNLKTESEVLAELQKELTAKGSLTKKDLQSIYGLGALDTVKNWLRACGLSTAQTSYSKEELKDFHYIYQEICKGRKFAEIAKELSEVSNQSQGQTFGTAEAFANNAVMEPAQVIRQAVFGSVVSMAAKEMQHILQPSVLSQITTIAMAQHLGANPNLAEDTVDFFSQSLQALPEMDMEAVLVEQLQTIGLLPEVQSQFLLESSKETKDSSSNSYLDVSAEAIDLYQTQE